MHCLHLDTRFGLASWPGALAAGALLVALPGCKVRQTSIAESASNIVGPGYTSMIDGIQQLADPNQLLTVTTYGQSALGQPLDVVKLVKKEAFAATSSHPAVLITEAIHGNEFLNIAARLPAAIITAYADHNSGTYKFLASGGAIFVVPVVNPDGYSYHVRGWVTDPNNLPPANPSTVSNINDLNRDFPAVDVTTGAQIKGGFTRPETTTLANLVESAHTGLNFEWRLTVDYHCCASAVLFPWGYSATATLKSEGDQRRFTDFGGAMAQALNFRSGNAQAMVGYSEPGMMADYLYYKYNSISLTVEGAVGSEDKNLAVHMSWLDQSLGKLAGPVVLNTKTPSTLATNNTVAPVTTAPVDPVTTAPGDSSGGGDQSATGAGEQPVTGDTNPPVNNGNGDTSPDTTMPDATPPTPVPVTPPTPVPVTPPTPVPVKPRPRYTPPVPSEAQLMANWLSQFPETTQLPTDISAYNIYCKRTLFENEERIDRAAMMENGKNTWIRYGYKSRRTNTPWAALSNTAAQALVYADPVMTPEHIAAAITKAFSHYYVQTWRVESCTVRDN